ncbi:MAG: HD domain-containing protein [Patescibacteria group bacterium]
MNSETEVSRQKVIELFSDLWKVVYFRHLKSGILSGCHDPFHTARVGQYAFEIAETPDVARLAGVAGLCHNADRILQHDLKVGRKDVPMEMVRDLVNKWLDCIDLSKDDRDLILDAVLNHSLPNDSNDGPVLMALKDADRLANLELDVIMRSAQFYPDFPVVDPVNWLSDPTATFREPKSVVKDLANNAEWGNFGDPKFGIRLSKAQLRATEFTNFLLDYIERVRKCWTDAGLLPFVTPEG